MKRIKIFYRAIRQELSRISVFLKQMEFKTARQRGFLKRKLREEIKELRRLKDSILHRLSGVSFEVNAKAFVMQQIREEITVLRDRCRNLKLQHF